MNGSPTGSNAVEGVVDYMRGREYILIGITDRCNFRGRNIKLHDIRRGGKADGSVKSSYIVRGSYRIEYSLGFLVISGYAAEGPPIVFVIIGGAAEHTKSGMYTALSFLPEAVRVRPEKVVPIATRAAMLKFIIFFIAFIVLMGLLLFNRLVPVVVLQAAADDAFGFHLEDPCFGAAIHFFFVKFHKLMICIHTGTQKPRSSLRSPR